MNLTAENTAVVLDSTSDYVDAPSRFSNMRFVPLYVRFGDETFKDYTELGPAEFYAKLRTSPVLPATSQPTPQDFLADVREPRGLRADLLAPRLGQVVRHVPERRARRFRARRRPSAHGRLEDGVARDRDARARDSASSRARHDRCRSSSVDRALPAGEHRRLHARDAGVPAARWSHRPGGSARRLALERPPDSERAGRRGDCGRARAWAEEGTRGVRAPFRGSDRGSPGTAGRDRARRRSGMGRNVERARAGVFAPRPRSSSLPLSAPSSARTRARAPSASSGSRMSERPRGQASA